MALQVAGANVGVWIYDLARGGTGMLLTTEQGSAQRPLWTPDGRRMTYRATRDGHRNLFWKPADGSGAEERLTTSEEWETPGSWSPDGNVLAFVRDDLTTGLDI